MKLMEYVSAASVEESVELPKKLILMFRRAPINVDDLGRVLGWLIVKNLVVSLSAPRLRLSQSPIKVAELDLEVFVGTLEGDQLYRLFVLLADHQSHVLLRGSEFLLGGVQGPWFPRELTLQFGTLLLQVDLQCPRSICWSGHPPKVINISIYLEKGNKSKLVNLSKRGVAY